MQVQQSENKHSTCILGYSRDVAYLPHSDRPYCLKCKDLDEIVNAIKDYKQVSSKRLAIRLLTLAPPVGISKKAFKV